MQKTSLIDYPGEICATLFTGGCNLRCPFCYNGDLVLNGQGLPLHSEEEILEFLKRRSGKLSAVCISGGEPTLQDDLQIFIAAVKGAGFKVKLDSNGTGPQVLQDLLEKGLLDYLAVDIKAPRDKYSSLTGVDMDWSRIGETVDLLRDNPVEYEFRTTLVPRLLCEEDILKIAEELPGCRRYYIQRFESSRSLLDSTLNGEKSPEREKMEHLARRCREFVETVGLRGF